MYSDTKIPWVSLGVGVLSLCLYFIDALAPTDICISLSTLLAKGQIWPSLAAPFFHSSFISLALNIHLLALFELSIGSLSLSPARYFSKVIATLYVTFIIVRVSLGWIFFYGTGWANPALFFSDAWHECASGLQPLLFTLLSIEPLLVGSNTAAYQIVPLDSRLRLSSAFVHAVLCVLSLLLQNQHTLWYNLSGLLCAVGATLAIMTYRVFKFSRTSSGSFQLDGLPKSVASPLLSVATCITPAPAIHSPFPVHASISSPPPVSRMDVPPFTLQSPILYNASISAPIARSVSLEGFLALEERAKLAAERVASSVPTTPVLNAVDFSEYRRRPSLSGLSPLMKVDSERPPMIDLKSIDGSVPVPPLYCPSLKEKYISSPLFKALRTLLIVGLLLTVRSLHTYIQHNNTIDLIKETTPHLVRMVEATPLDTPAPLLVVMIPTVPRPGHQRHLLRTLDGLLDQWPDDDSHFLYNRLVVRVYGAPNHPVFEEARDMYSRSPKGRHYIQWLQTLTTSATARPEQTSSSKARRIQPEEEMVPASLASLDSPPAESSPSSYLPVRSVSASASESSTSTHQPVKNGTSARNQQMLGHRIMMFEDAIRLNSKYSMILEDDFVLCEGGWADILLMLDVMQIRNPNHCGAFVATGGSGLMVQNTAYRAMLAELARARDSELATPADVVMQDCLLGTPSCPQCRDSLVVPKTMLFAHIGFDSSTVENSYKAEEWQCGWRQVFNGRPDVLVL